MKEVERRWNERPFNQVTDSLQGTPELTIGNLLSEWIKNYTQEEIATMVTTETGVYVTQGTISQWCKKFKIKAVA